MKRILSLFVVLTLMFSIVPNFAINATAEVSANGEFEYSPSNTGTCVIYKYFGTSSSVEIPATIDGYTVTEIGFSCFRDCTNITSVTIPETVTRFRIGAFMGSGIKSLHIPKNVTEIYDFALADCSNLESITVDPENTVFKSVDNCLIKTDSKTLIRGCKNGSIPEGIEIIGANAFSCSVGLKQINLPSSLKTIKEYAFLNCFDLLEIDFPESVTEICHNAFENCTSLTSVTIPDSITELPTRVFGDCTNVSKIHIGKNLEELDHTAFGNCNIDTITVDQENSTYEIISDSLVKSSEKLLVRGSNNSKIPLDGSIKEIGHSAFNGCKNLESITIPESANYIGYETFANCTSLKNVTIPTSVTLIRHRAFKNCTSLKNITIPVSVWSVSTGAFQDCSQLNEVYYGGIKPDWENIYIETDNDCLTNAKRYYLGNCKHEATTVINKAESTCAKKGYSGDTYCNNCDKVIAVGIEIGAKHEWGKNYVSKKATASSNGAISKKCLVCNTAKKVSTIYKIKTVKLAKTSVTYTGRTQKPKVTVKDSKGKTISSSYYTVKYTNNKKVGKASVKITFKGNYRGTKTKTFKINPKATKIISLKAGKKAFTVKYKKQTSGSGYVIQYSTSSKFKSSKTVKIKSNKTVSVTVKKLKANKTYYVRVRTVKGSYKSSWSTAKKDKTK